MQHPVDLGGPLSLKTAYEIRIRDTGALLASLPFKVEPNSATETADLPPSPPDSVTVAPSQPDQCQPLLCTVVMPAIDDPNYDVLTFEYRWFVDGVPMKPRIHAGQRDVLIAQSVGTEVRCEVTVHDSHFATDAVPSNVVTVVAACKPVPPPTSCPQCLPPNCCSQGLRRAPGPGDWIVIHRQAVPASVPPRLGVEGQLVAGATISWTLSTRTPHRAAVWLVGPQRLDARIAGQTLVPEPWIAVPAALDGLGGASLQVAVPESIAAGQDLFVQAWTAGEERGVTASNALWGRTR